MSYCALLFAALGFVLLDLRGELPALTAFKRWLGSWRSIRLIASGRARQGYDLQLTRYDERGWRATFYLSGMEHSATSATGSAFEPTPWRAVQKAARMVLVQSLEEAT